MKNGLAWLMFEGAAVVAAPFPALGQSPCAAFQCRLWAERRVAQVVFSEIIEERLPVVDCGNAAMQLAAERAPAHARQAEVIRLHPQGFLPLVVAAMIILSPDELVIHAESYEQGPEGYLQYYRFDVAWNVAVDIMRQLPAELTESILQDTFRRLLKEGRAAVGPLQVASDAWVKAGRPREDRAAMDMANRRFSWYRCQCELLIDAAVAAGSNVLAEEVLTGIALGDRAAGLNGKGIEYLQSFPAQKAEFAQRLKELKGARTDRTRIPDIDEAIARLDGSKGARP